MKKNQKNQRKSKGAATRKQSQHKNTHISSLELDTSLDEIFRFDDKLIGKRTNVIFEPKAVADGFYDMEYNSNLSLNTSESLSLYKVDAISEMDEKKNEKMVRMLKAIEMEESKMDLSDLSQMEKSIEEIEENQSEENQNEESNLKKNTEKVFLSNNRTNQKDEKSEPKEIPTIEKLLPQESVSQVADQEKSTKSRADLSKQKKKDARGTEVKKEQKNEDKNKPIRRLRSSSNHRKNEEQPVRRQSNYERKIRQAESKNNIFKLETSVNAPKTITQTLVEARNKRQEEKYKTDQQHKSKNISLHRKRAPRDSSNQSSDSHDSTQKLQMFEVTLNVQRPGINEEYKPFGTMADGLYPRRLRIPPLRYFFHERRNYAGGLLQSLTLIDDVMGREIEKSILEQLENSE